MAVVNQPNICIVGAGMSGILMAVKLIRSGRTNFTIFEKAKKVGGTWRENRYPGVACDVASFSYCYEFEPNPNWTHRFSSGGEIQQYFEGVAKKYNLDKWIQYEAEVSKAEYLNGEWVVTTQSSNGEEVTHFDIFVAATGPLNKKKYPKIPGIDDFKGAMFHTADWDDDYELSGKRAAVIGSGSSAVQLTGAIASLVKHFTVFQRTPQWVATMPNLAYSDLTIKLKNTFPVLGRMTRAFYFWVGGQFGKAALKDGLRRKLVQKSCEWGLKLAIRDPELRAKTTPADLAMCRRMIMSSSYFPALAQDNVDVVTDAIECITETGIKTVDGKIHELDLIVLATGFHPNYWGVQDVRGENGKHLDEAWSDGKLRTFNSITLPGFPNYFMLIGPNSPITNLSLIEVSDIGIDYIFQCIEKIERGELKSISVKQSVTDAFNEKLNRSFEGTIWVTGCNSWYLDDEGLPVIWPWAPAEFLSALKVLDLNDYDVT
ncbi:MAG: NAD(P)/FAD-dependent oxidoreductase [Sinobacterium sp.]|nr:NAD(P)/FAD-dependent oxidoreductase [Sinobacterium sp.]